MQEIEITKQNCHKAIAGICKQAGITRKELAQLLGVSPSNITRIEKNKEAAGEDFMNRLRALQVLGHAKFKKLTASDKKKAAAASGQSLTTAGVLAGLTALGSAKFAVAGLVSIPLFGLGAVVLGYGIIKALKHLCDKNNLSCREDKGNILIQSMDSLKEKKNGKTSNRN